jgi:hypothetical protein
MKNSGRQRKPYKIARRFAREGDRHVRTPDELEEGPETLGVAATFWFFLVAQKEQMTNVLRSLIYKIIKVRVSRSSVEAYRLTPRDRLVENVTLEANPSPSAVRVVYGRRRGGRSFGTDWQFFCNVNPGNMPLPGVWKSLVRTSSGS